MAWDNPGRRADTAQTRRLRRQALERDGGQCQIRGPRCEGAGGIVDHIVPLAEGGGDDLDNLRVVCYPCHRTKTAEESARGRARVRATARRAPVRHPGLL